MNQLGPRVVNPHAAEKIGTVQEMYDGALLPDIAVNTFRNVDRLFATRAVQKSSRAYPLPSFTSPLRNVRFKSDGNDYDVVADLRDVLSAGARPGADPPIIRQGSAGGAGSDSR